MAENLKWPREHWTLLLQSVVIGKAREIYTQLSLEQSSDYDTVKELILKAYKLVPEAYRQKFRDCRKEPNQTHVEFARTKEQLFDRWCSSKKVGSDHEKLRQLMLVEEFKWCINSVVRAFLNEKEVENLDVAARLADDYSSTHKASFVSKPFPRKPFKVSKVVKIRKRYNQVPHLTQDTNGKVTNSQKTAQTRAKRSALSQQVTTKHI